MSNPSFVFTSLRVERIYSIDGNGPSWPLSNIASSSDGTKLVGESGDGKLYTSIDSGDTWIKSLTIDGLPQEDNYFSGLTSSSDGTKLATVTSNTYINMNLLGGGFIFISIDSGKNWIKSLTIDGLPQEPAIWNCITSSSDGTTLVASNRIFTCTSIDSGLNWIKILPIRYVVPDTNGKTIDIPSPLKFIASSSDGTKLVGIGNMLFKSIDSGRRWPYIINIDGIPQSLYTGGLRWNYVASSSDGTKLVASNMFNPEIRVDNPTGTIYTSIDSGLNWIKSLTVDGKPQVPYIWLNLASSSDGTRLAAIAGKVTNYDTWTNYDNQFIYASVDSGKNWYKIINSSPGFIDYRYSFLTLSPDGTKITTGMDPNYSPSNTYIRTFTSVTLYNILSDYKINGTFLYEIFKPYVSGPMAPITNYKVSDGRDLNELLAPYVSGSKAPITNYKVSDGRDLNELFAPL